MLQARASRGFTLIELMIVVAIIAIIAAIAIPSYTQYVENARAGDAKGALMSLANAMERYHTQNNTYVGATVGSGAGDIFPAEAPLDGNTKFYDLVIVAANTTATAYRIEARPKNGQGGGTIALLSTGQRVNWD
ncbi:MAG: type IV pilin protein [Marinobacter sp.]|uniref:type IV pilin protein n=1 Tax=Marinobacter sp. TaxID=50741 RepID=UPI00299EC155|nr:type IV pilin protein [Marinobacter sp.]MDX1757275.1 type IV pilin protein [Marinobacter sp.]